MMARIWIGRISTPMHRKRYHLMHHNHSVSPSK
jgi:hypothetical protein